MNDDKQLKYIIENAIDFLHRSILDFDSSPKYSVINFHTSIELFLKARIMAEHWSLIVANGRDLDQDKFLAGDFQSVTLRDVIDRLKKVVKVSISDELTRSIESLSRHRNKIMHFFHEAHADPNLVNIKTIIAKEQLACWYQMNLFLNNECKDIFSPWNEKFSLINTEFKKQKDFLQITFEKLKTEILALQSTGNVFKECPSCNFKAMVDNKKLNSLVETRCMVCDVLENTVTIECPDCSSLVTFVEEGYSICQNCHKEFDPDLLAETLSPEITYDNYYDDSLNLGNCADCDGYHTVVRDPAGGYLCTQCFGKFDILDQCHWCNEPNTKDMSFTGIFGCGFCSGSSNYD